MDVDLDRGQIMIRSGKGDKDRVTMLPVGLREPFSAQIERVARRHAIAVDRGRG
jgi:hypothetical protein